MFSNESLAQHLATSSTIKSEALVVAEWNMNISENILRIGNYRYRPTSNPEVDVYAVPPNNFDPNDSGSFYTGATDSDIVIDGGVDNVDVPVSFQSAKQKEKLLFSLEACFGKFRPRSGINKLRFFDNGFTHHTNIDMARRPRYYMPDKDDKFKYWTSYRTEVEGSTTVERGIAKIISNGKYFIEDAAPFVVYKEPVPTNKIVIKMQTNVGDVNIGSIKNGTTTIDDPFFGESNQTTPKDWKIQYLNETGSWVDALVFNDNFATEDGALPIGPDGYVEVVYGLIVPDQFKANFIFAGEYANSASLPAESIEGAAYLVGATEVNPGLYYVWQNGEYAAPFTPEYGWYLGSQDATNSSRLVKNLVNPPTYQNPLTGALDYREFKYVYGLRTVVSTMNKYDSSFDLIELSPRLEVDLTDRVETASVQKIASDLGVSGMPVGQLLASTGSIGIFDFDEAFNANNNNSIISGFVTQNIKFNIYEVVLDVEGFNYYVPIKTLYIEGFPEVSSKDRSVDISLRDGYFYLESTTAPQLMVKSASLSYAVSLLLDSIGFSNYVFRRTENEVDPVIPYFFIAPDKSVAEVLNEIAISTQSAMFFDEYNNFVVMTKNYMMPSLEERPTDIVLNGSSDSYDSGILENETSGTISNIVEIASQNSDVYNDGVINYTTRYIQRTYGSLRQASLLDKEKVWIYKPVLLWEVAGEENTKSFNDEVSSQSSYALTAIPLNSSLSSSLPRVVNHELVDNIIDLGEGVYWLPRYNGYFYANSEIIKYDAVEYSVTGTSFSGNVWISSVREYQNYFSKLSFNGKIYPTGRVRIFSEPRYETINETTRMVNGAVSKHGRGQFGTSIVNHEAGVSDYWTSNQGSISGFTMDSRHVFSGPYELVFANATSVGSTTIEVGNTASIVVGSIVTIINDSPTGKLNEGGQTLVTAIVDETTFTVDRPVAISLEDDVIRLVENITGEKGVAGVYGAKKKVSKTSRNGIIKNFLSTEFTDESNIKNISRPQNGTIQSSALIMAGGEVDSPIDFISYSHKPLESQFRHFGTRMRIVGSANTNVDALQTPFGAMTMYSVKSTDPNVPATVSGSSGGLAVMLNTETNNGYFFEIVALGQDSFTSYAGNDEIANLIFYKTVQNRSYSVFVNYNLPATLSADANGDLRILTANANGELAVPGYLPKTGDRVLVNGQTNANADGYYVITKLGDEDTKWSMTKDDSALPVKLWSGMANILVDDGKFTGQSRMLGEENPTVYDLAVEYEPLGSSRRFYLYLNNTIIAVVNDSDPLPIVNNMALFIRGTSRCMFENIYAIGANYANNTAIDSSPPALNEAFGGDEVSMHDSLTKYAISGMIQNTYLSGVSPINTPKYNLYFEEFGTIMREAAYFKVKYDKAYPALYAKISPTFNNLKGYTVSGFTADAYGAEFLVFNNTDTVLNLDETTGNYLRIQGVTFTQQSSQELTVDDFFEKKSTLSDPEISEDGTITNPQLVKEKFTDIKFSRLTHGKKEFSIDAPYIQTQDDANNLMEWMISKLMKPRKSVGINVFAMPTLQLGDIVQINYSSSDGVDAVAPISSRFVVYNIEYSRSAAGPDFTVYLSEVL